MVFGIPKEVDDFFHLGLILLVIISVMINTYLGGTCAISLIHDTTGISPSDESFKVDPMADFSSYQLQSQVDVFKKNSIRAYWITTILYWIGLPLLCFYYAFFKFKPEMYSDQNLPWREYFSRMRKKLLKEKLPT